jgi:hypothetical protein
VAVAVVAVSAACLSLFVAVSAVLPTTSFKQPPRRCRRRDGVVHVDICAVERTIGFEGPATKSPDVQTPHVDIRKFHLFT